MYGYPFYRYSSIFFSLISALFLTSIQFLVISPSSYAATRDPLLWPFSPTSIWNMPIGSNAHYVDALIGSRGFGTDIDWFIITHASDPQVSTYMPATWGQGRCAGTTPQQQAQWHPEAGQPMHVPSDLIIPDAITSGNIYWTPNSSSAFLQPDGKTLANFNVTARCQAGGPLYGTWFGQSDLYGDGIGGGHGGSAMSSIGGSIRTGELLDDQPLHHALKIDIWGNWMHYDTTGQGHRWPAALADGGAPQQYKGNNPALVMGSLLALPPDVTPASLGISSSIGKKIFYAFQNYGAYVVDDSGGDTNDLCVEHNADVEFKNATGHSIDKDSGLIADFNRIIAGVKVVDNNTATTIGGGGTPRVPLAPAFGAPIPQPQPSPTPTSVPTATPTPVITATAQSVNHRSGTVNIGEGGQTANHSGNPSTVTTKPLLTNPSSGHGFPWLFVGGLLALLLVGGGGWLGWKYYGNIKRKA